MNNLTMTHAPWSYAQVDGLRQWQSGPFHPFTCPRRNDSTHRVTSDLGVLEPTEQGWICPDCDYVQDWAYDFMFLDV